MTPTQYRRMTLASRRSDHPIPLMTGPHLRGFLLYGEFVPLKSISFEAYFAEATGCPIPSRLLQLEYIRKNRLTPSLP